MNSLFKLQCKQNYSKVLMWSNTNRDLWQVATADGNIKETYYSPVVPVANPLSTGLIVNLVFLTSVLGVVISF